jgi:hypothetical protein
LKFEIDLISFKKKRDNGKMEQYGDVMLNGENVGQLSGFDEAETTSSASHGFRIPSLLKWSAFDCWATCT